MPLVVAATGYDTVELLSNDLDFMERLWWRVYSIDGHHWQTTNIFVTRSQFQVTRPGSRCEPHEIVPGDTWQSTNAGFKWNMNSMYNITCYQNFIDLPGDIRGVLYSGQSLSSLCSWLELGLLPPMLSIAVDGIQKTVTGSVMSVPPVIDAR